jgi:hypothetical protein
MTEKLGDVSAGVAMIVTQVIVPIMTATPQQQSSTATMTSRDLPSAASASASLLLPEAAIDRE